MRRAMMILGVLLAAAAVAGAALLSPVDAAPRAQTAAKGLRLLKVGNFKTPVYVAAPPRDRKRVFVVEKGGRIRVVRKGKVLERPFLDISGQLRSDGEEGLLSMAFAPDYAKSRRFYVFYTLKGSTHQRVAEFTARTRNRAARRSEREVITIDDPGFSNNGGQLQFGPDGHLYISVGDGGGEESGPGDPGNNAQDLGSLSGKLLRIDPRRDGYSVPASNPFTGPGQRREIYAYGLRNPFRFSFDRKTGDLILSDVGRAEQEEVDYFPRGAGRGANLGWRVYEGRSRYRPDEQAPGAVSPTIVLKHSDENCAVTGGYVSRDRKVRVTYGRYLFADLCHGDILSSKLRRPTATHRSTGLNVPQVVSFGQDARKRLYAVSINGPVYRIAAGRG